jgi:hypothetical protein
LVLDHRAEHWRSLLRAEHIVLVMAGQTTKEKENETYLEIPFSDY